jgi:Kef-type K+ transport system membrane component KefB
MTPFLQLTLVLAILIASAKVGGYLSYRIKQPAVLGELLVGVILGPSLIDILHQPFITDRHLPEIIHELAEFGVMLLMFLAGLELHFSDLIKSGKVAAFAGSLGVITPLILGTGLVFVFPLSITEALFLGLILSATSVSISAQTLMELKVLRSRVGISLLGAAVFDDILVVLGLSVFSALAMSNGTGDLSQVVIILLQMVFYLLIASALGLWLLPRLSKAVTEQPISQGLLSFTFVVLLLYGWAAEIFGNMAAITGAFLAGLLFARSPVRERIERGMVSLAYGFFVPIFFIDVGLKANIRELVGPTFWLFLVMSILAIIGKIFGSGLGATIAGFNRKESLQLGIGMMSRGEVGLIVASVGISQAIISQTVFSAVVGVVILTTLLTPPLLRLSFRDQKAQDKGGNRILKEQEIQSLNHSINKGEGK